MVAAPSSFSTLALDMRASALGWSIRAALVFTSMSSAVRALSQRERVTLFTDSVLALSTVVVALQQLGARRVDPTVGIACMVNQLQAGSANNVVPEQAVASGTVRTMRETDRQQARDAMRDIASHVAAAHGCTAEVRIARGEPALVNDEHLATRTHLLLEEMGHPVTADFRSFGSDDFAHYCGHTRGLMLFVGTGDADGRLHDATFLPDDRYIATVADALVAGYCAAVDG